jgi:metal-responsive CopG/Arc/MetJ family transcriptional regulator
MARVLISLPDDLLARLDALASERQMTRSQLIRVLVEHEVTAAERCPRAEVRALLSEPGHYGGGSADEIRRLRRRP